MTTLSELYNNIKTFVLQAFESKEEEYTNLSNEVVEIIQYIDGKIVVFDSPVMIIKGQFKNLLLSFDSTTPNDILISYGDGSNSIYEGFSHTYEESGEYTIRVKGVTSLKNACFAGYTGLTSIFIPDSVTSIGEGCFDNCSSLTSISIPNSVTSIGGYCFYSCTRLTNIKLNWTTTNEIVSYSSGWIGGANADLKFTIPAGTTSMYVAKGYPSSKLVEASD